MASSSEQSMAQASQPQQSVPAGIQGTTRRVVVDPVTRIEGHLRIEAETDAQGMITRASSSGTMVRGIEIILKGRDPRDAWAFTQRFCGVCTVVHSIASVRAVEYALGYVIPQNAQHIRNLMIAAQFVHDHVMHFYHLHALDWVDVVSALKADPVATAKLQTSLSTWPNNTTEHFRGVQQKLKGFVEGGQLGIFANGYWGHPAYKLPPEVNLLAVAHYLEALAWQRDVVKIHAIFGGKNPHPNFVVGGAPCAISRDGARDRGDTRKSAPRRRADRQDADLRRSGVSAGHARDRRLLQGLGKPRRGGRQLPVVRRIPARRRRRRADHAPDTGGRDPEPGPVEGAAR